MDIDYPKYPVIIMKIRTPDIPPEPVKTEVSYESESTLTDENEG